MKRRSSALGLAIVWSFVIFATAAVAPMDTGLAAQNRKSDRPSKKNDKKTKKERPAVYAVVKIGETLRVVPKSELKALKKKVDQDNKQARKDWQEAKKAAKKAKQKFDAKPPKKVGMKVIRAGFKSEDAANAFKASKESGGGSKSATRAERFVVVDAGGEAKVITQAEFADSRKKADAEHKTALAAWSKAKREAAKAKQAFTEPRPKRVDMKKLAGPFPGRDKADAFVAKRKAQAEKAARAKAAKAAKRAGSGGTSGSKSGSSR